MVRRTKRDIPLARHLSKVISDDPESFGNYITSCIDAAEWYGVPPQMEKEDGSPSDDNCLDAILSKSGKTPVTLTEYKGRDNRVSDEIRRWGEFKTNLSRALFHLYAKNPKMDPATPCKSDVKRVKYISCISKVLDSWKDLPSQERYTQMIESAPAIVSAPRCSHGDASVSCISKVMRENEDMNFLVYFMLMSGIDLTKDCGLATEPTGVSCLQQIYESKSTSISNVFTYLMGVPEIAENLKRPIWFTPYHPTSPITGYQYLIESLTMGNAVARVVPFFTHATGLMNVRFLDEDPHRTGFVFTNPLDYIMRVYATEDPDYPAISQQDRDNILNVAFESKEMSESVAKPVCRAAGDEIPCIDAIISSNVAPGKPGQEKMKSKAFTSIDLATARCSSPTGTMSCFEKAMRFPGNFKYVKEAITSGTADLKNAQCGDTTCLDMVVSGTSKANLADTLSTGLRKAAEKAASKHERAKSDVDARMKMFGQGADILGVPLWEQPSRAMFFEEAAKIAEANAGPMAKIPVAERNQLMNLVIRKNANSLVSAGCRNLALGGSLGGVSSGQFVSEWSTKKVSPGIHLDRRIKAVEQSLTDSGRVSCMQRVFQIMETDPDSIETGTVAEIVANPAVDLNVNKCHDYDIDKSVSCAQASVTAAKMYGLHQWRLAKYRGRSEAYTAVPESSSDKESADAYLNQILDKKGIQDLLSARCTGVTGNDTSCLAAIIERKYNPALSKPMSFSIIQKSFNEVKDIIVNIGGVEKTLGQIVCGETAGTAREYLRHIGEDKGGDAIEGYGKCHGCIDNGTFEARKCFDRICFNGIAVQSYQVLKEYQRDGTMYSGNSDVLGISGVYDVRKPFIKDTARAQSYMERMQEQEDAAKRFLTAPDVVSKLKTTFKKQPAFATFGGFRYPTKNGRTNADGVFEKEVDPKTGKETDQYKDVRFVVKYVNTEGIVIEELTYPISQISTGKSPFAKIIAEYPDFAQSMDKAIKSKPPLKGTTMTMVISRRPADIMRASTCQNWTSCMGLDEHWQSLPNGTSLPLIHDLNGYMAYIASSEFSPAWKARAMLMPADKRKGSDYDYPPKQAKCAFVWGSNMHGLPDHKELLARALSEVFYQNGINRECDNLKAKNIIGWDSAKERMTRMFKETKKNCIDYNYGAEIDKITRVYEEVFGSPIPTKDLEALEATRGEELRRRAEEACHIRVRGTYTPEDLPDRLTHDKTFTPIAEQYVKFVPPGGIASFTYYPYFGTTDYSTTTDLGDNPMWGLSDEYDVSATEAGHRQSVAKYGEDFVKKRRNVTYENPPKIPSRYAVA